MEISYRDSFLVHPSTMCVRYGPPIDVVGVEVSCSPELQERVRAEIALYESLR